MTGINCDLFTHNQSRSYLNHLVNSTISSPAPIRGKKACSFFHEFLCYAKPVLVDRQYVGVYERYVRSRSVCLTWIFNERGDIIYSKYLRNFAAKTCYLSAMMTVA